MTLFLKSYLRAMQKKILKMPLYLLILGREIAALFPLVQGPGDSGAEGLCRLIHTRRWLRSVRITGWRFISAPSSRVPGQRAGETAGAGRTGHRHSRSRSPRHWPQGNNERRSRPHGENEGAVRVLVVCARRNAGAGAIAALRKLGSGGRSVNRRELIRARSRAPAGLAPGTSGAQPAAARSIHLLGGPTRGDSAEEPPAEARSTDGRCWRPRLPGAGR